MKNQKKQHPQIQRILVLAYLGTRQDVSDYDGTLYPPLETVPRRFAIPRRNRWMVDASDAVVACVLHDWGGAAATLRYARQKGKWIIAYEQPQLHPHITEK